MPFRRRLRPVLPLAPARPALLGRPGDWVALLALLALSACDVATTSGGGTADARSAAPSTSSSLDPTPTTPALHVVVLGDSVATAANCDCDDFGDRATRQLAARMHRPTSLDNLAVGGATTANVLALLQTASAHETLAAADLVVIQIGANDFDEADAYRTACLHPLVSGCARQTYATTSANLTTIVETVRTITAPNHAVVGLMDYWNIFRDGSVGQREGATYAAASRAMSQVFSREVREVARTTGVAFVDATTPLIGDGSRDPTDLLTDDGDHPDDAGQQALADALVEAVAPALTSRRS